MMDIYGSVIDVSYIDGTGFKLLKVFIMLNIIMICNHAKVKLIPLPYVWAV